MSQRTLLTLALPLALVLAGCASPSPEPPPEPAPPAPDPVTELRETARAASSALEVEPLQDPAVDALVAQAERDERRGDREAALKAIVEALTIEPDNPRLWQLRAELLLGLGRYLEAEEAAMRSYRRSAQLGQWCMRNWLVLAATRRAMGDEEYAAAAARRAAECPVPAPARY